MDDANRLDDRTVFSPFDHRRNLRGRGVHGTKVAGLSPSAYVENMRRIREQKNPETEVTPVKQLMKDGVWLTEERPVAPHIKELAKKIRARIK